MQQIAEAIVNRYFRTNPQKITSLGGGWYGRVFLAEMTDEPTKVIIKIHLDDNPLPNDPGYDAHIAALNAAFDRDSVNGLLRCDRVTKVYSERIE
ncbi:hypothetical protein [Lachnoclostridium phytofermentans]|uniref:Uncharacterized protein n=1 Tax=Lachnoclostridium phytofermentans (strain ATCC 700394 / DSM 18823 / ISDg) TaxID=357809 RepID=A9KSF5_LACP7|nr:hypothetical protein [Lachnoclostridium phytofermentans]ABX43607.1 hypothetical protein Cphy_3253 [Lachnoclostridium phytofermentans ISDg]